MESNKTIIDLKLEGTAYLRDSLRCGFISAIQQIMLFCMLT